MRLTGETRILPSIKISARFVEISHGILCGQSIDCLCERIGRVPRKWDDFTHTVATSLDGS